MIQYPYKLLHFNLCWMAIWSWGLRNCCECCCCFLFCKQSLIFLSIFLQTEKEMHSICGRKQHARSQCSIRFGSSRNREYRHKCQQQHIHCEYEQSWKSGLNGPSERRGIMQSALRRFPWNALGPICLPEPESFATEFPCDTRKMWCKKLIKIEILQSRGLISGLAHVACPVYRENLLIYGY